MSNDLRSNDARVIWKEQPKEDSPVIFGQVTNRRTQQLRLGTRSEIIMSLIAALYCIAVLAWRLPEAGIELRPLGLAAAAVWIAITAFRFRRVIWRPDAPPDAASTGLFHYRRQLELRRDHLRNAWLWHGPLAVAVLLLVAHLTGPAFPGVERWRNAAPLCLVLVLWITVAIRRRFRHAAGIQREIDEINRIEERQ